MSKPLAAYTLTDAIRVYLLWCFRKPLMIGAALIGRATYRHAEEHPAPPCFQRICTDMNEADGAGASKTDGWRPALISTTGLAMISLVRAVRCAGRLLPQDANHNQ